MLVDGAHALGPTQNDIPHFASTLRLSSINIFWYCDIQNGIFKDYLYLKKRCLLWYSHVFLKWIKIALAELLDIIFKSGY